MAALEPIPTVGLFQYGTALMFSPCSDPSAVDETAENFEALESHLESLEGPRVLIDLRPVNEKSLAIENNPLVGDLVNLLTAIHKVPDFLSVELVPEGNRDSMWIHRDRKANRLFSSDVFHALEDPPTKLLQVGATLALGKEGNTDGTILFPNGRRVGNLEAEDYSLVVSGRGVQDLRSAEVCPQLTWALYDKNFYHCPPPHSPGSRVLLRIAAGWDLSEQDEVHGAPIRRPRFDSVLFDGRPIPDISMTFPDSLIRVIGPDGVEYELVGKDVVTQPGIRNSWSHFPPAAQTPRGIAL